MVKRQPQTTQFQALTYTHPLSSKNTSFLALMLMACLCAFFSVSQHALASDTPPGTSAPEGVSEETTKLMALTNLNRQLETLPGSLIQALKSSGKQTVAIPASLITTLTEAVQVSFVVEDLRAKLATEIDQQLSEVERKKLLTWYDSNLGKRIARAESRAASPEGIQNMLQQAGKLLADQRLLPYIAEIDRAIDASGFTIRLQKLTQRAIFQASSVGLRPEAPVDVSHFDKQWAQQTDQIEAATDQLMTLTYAYSYQNLANAELDRYVAFLKSPVAVKFNTIVSETIEDLFKASSDHMVQYVVEKPEQSPLAY